METLLHSNLMSVGGDGGQTLSVLWACAVQGHVIVHFAHHLTQEALEYVTLVDLFGSTLNPG